MSGTRVSEIDSEFDDYIRNTTTVLETGTPAGSVRLGLTTAENDDWVAFRDAWIVVYPKYTNVSRRTSIVTQQKNNLKKDFREFAKIPLKRIEVSPNLTEEDRGTFNLPVPDTTPTRRGAITDVPFGSLVGKGGGMMEVRARRESDATRSSKHPLADAVELRYLILNDSTTPPDEGSGGDFPSPEDCRNSVSSKSALWRVSLGSAARGKTVLGYLRWVNLSNPANNSGWSMPMVGIIS